MYRKDHKVFRNECNKENAIVVKKVSRSLFILRPLANFLRALVNAKKNDGLPMRLLSVKIRRPLRLRLNYSFDSQLPYGMIVYLQPELVFIYTAACFATANGLCAIDVLDYCLNITLPERLNYAGTKIVRRKISRV